MARYGMVIDAEHCIGCFNCYLACRDEHAGNDHLPVAAAQAAAGRSWISVRLSEHGAFPKIKVSRLPVPCLHCAEAPCMSAASGGAVYRRDDGIVLIDPVKSAGQRDLVSSCPYGAIVWNEERNLPQKCTLCAHLLDEGWKEPRCVEACPTQALVFGDLDDPASRVSTLRAQTEELHPEFGLKPVVRHLGLPKRFVAGEIAFGDKPEEPAAGVALTLRRGTQTLAVTTDHYGDFEFDGLNTDTEYVLGVAQAGYEPRELPVRTQADLNLGTIVLNPAP